MRKIDLIFVLVVAFALFVCASGVASAKTIHVPSEYYPTIQSAINNVTTHDGDTILVAAGTYYGYYGVIDLYKSLILKGEKGAVIDGHIQATKDCTISGFIIRGHTSAGDRSIITNNVLDNGYISAGHESKISNNEINGGDASAGDKSEVSNNVIHNGYIRTGEDSTISNNRIYDYDGEGGEGRAIGASYRSEISNT